MRVDGSGFAKTLVKILSARLRRLRIVNRHARLHHMTVVLIAFLGSSLYFFSTSAQASLVAHWTFDTQAGATVPDVSGNGHDGTLQNAAALDPNFAPATGGNPTSAIIMVTIKPLRAGRLREPVKGVVKRRAMTLVYARFAASGADPGKKTENNEETSQYSDFRGRGGAGRWHNPAFHNGNSCPQQTRGAHAFR